jgi:hypothetical protein
MNWYGFVSVILDWLAVLLSVAVGDSIQNAQACEKVQVEVLGDASPRRSVFRGRQDILIMTNLTWPWQSISTTICPPSSIPSFLRFHRNITCDNHSVLLHDMRVRTRTARFSKSLYRPISQTPIPPSVSAWNPRPPIASILCNGPTRITVLTGPSTCTRTDPSSTWVPISCDADPFQDSDRSTGDETPRVVPLHDVLLTI